MPYGNQIAAGARTSVGEPATKRVGELVDRLMVVSQRLDELLVRVEPPKPADVGTASDVGAGTLWAALDSAERVVHGIEARVLRVLEVV